jgi:hypothetical protein
MSRPIPEPVAWDEAARVEGRRLWAAVMLTHDADVCASILRGRPVLARQLDAVALTRALRGERLPAPQSYFRVRPGHLDAVAEGGPFEPAAKGDRR